MLANSELGQLCEQNRLNLPAKTNLITNDDYTAPYFLLGDEVFPLKKWLMRPYLGLDADEEERVYNYRHSRGRRVIENTFGIVTSRWRIFQKPIRATVSNLEKYTMACLALHNYLRQTQKMHSFHHQDLFILKMTVK